MIYIGTVFYGYCNGYFGRDSYSDEKIVIGVGEDWIVIRDSHWSSEKKRTVYFPHMAEFEGGVAKHMDMIEKWKVEQIDED